MSYYSESPNKQRTTTTAYKQVFNKHRRKPDEPAFIGDLADLVDFSINPNADRRIVDLTKTRINAEQELDRDNSFRYQGPIYGLNSHPGFAYIPSALSPKIQHDLAYKALTEFCEEPHGTNIDLIPLKEDLEVPNVTKDETMWELWKKENINDNSLGETNNEQIDSTISSKEKKRYYKSFEKISWATLGYRFDWTARAYREKNKSAMPKILDQLGCYFAKLGEEVKEDGNIHNYSFTASAAIVNYYSLKSSMGGHRDDSELDITKPVVSFSLGLPAVFMIGGKTTEETPIVPLLLRPGDVMLLGGDSRLNFHGVARILSEDLILPSVGSHIGDAKVSDFQIDSWDRIFGNETGVENISTPHSDYMAIKKFLSRFRINANVRQVLPDGIFKIPGDDECN